MVLHVIEDIRCMGLATIIEIMWFASAVSLNPNSHPFSTALSAPHPQGKASLYDLKPLHPDIDLNPLIAQPTLT